MCQDGSNRVTRDRLEDEEVEVSNYVPCIEKLKNEVMVQNLL